MRHLVAVLLLLVLVAGCGQGPNPQQEAILKQDRTAWKKLAKGMPPEKVKAVLGEPLRAEDQAEVTCWYYRESQPLEKDATNPKKWVVPRGALLFARASGSGSRLAEWREP